MADTNDKRKNKQVPRKQDGLVSQFSILNYKFLTLNHQFSIPNPQLSNLISKQFLHSRVSILKFTTLATHSQLLTTAGRLSHLSQTLFFLKKKASKPNIAFWLILVRCSRGEVQHIFAGQNCKSNQYSPCFLVKTSPTDQRRIHKNTAYARLGFRVLGSGFKDQNIGFRVMFQVLSFKFWGLGLRV